MNLPVLKLCLVHRHSALVDSVGSKRIKNIPLKRRCARTDESRLPAGPPGTGAPRGTRGAGGPLAYVRHQAGSAGKNQTPLNGRPISACTAGSGILVGERIEMMKVLTFLDTGECKPTIYVCPWADIHDLHPFGEIDLEHENPRQLVRLEAYKLGRHLTGMELHRALRAWW